MLVDMHSQLVQIPESRYKNDEEAFVLYEKIVQDIKLNLLPLAGSNKYVFIRFQSELIPSFVLNTFFEMQLMGYIPVIANVERNVELVNNMRKLRAFVERGALVHVGAASILGENGKNTQKKALKLCRGGLVHLISPASPDFKKGPSLLKPAYAYLEKKLSLNMVEYFKKNAESVINGLDFHIKNPNQIGKSSPME